MSYLLVLENDFAWYFPSENEGKMKSVRDVGFFFPSWNLFCLENENNCFELELFKQLRFIYWNAPLYIIKLLAPE